MSNIVESLYRISNASESVSKKRLKESLEDSLAHIGSTHDHLSTSFEYVDRLHEIYGLPEEEIIEKAKKLGFKVYTSPVGYFGIGKGNHIICKSLDDVIDDFSNDEDLDRDEHSRKIKTLMTNPGRFKLVENLNESIEDTMELRVVYTGKKANRVYCYDTSDSIYAAKKYLVDSVSGISMKDIEVGYVDSTASLPERFLIIDNRGQVRTAYKGGNGWSFNEKEAKENKESFSKEYSASVEKGRKDRKAALEKQKEETRAKNAEKKRLHDIEVAPNKAKAERDHLLKPKRDIIRNSVMKLSEKDLDFIVNYIEKLGLE